jgi:hypothetical protein
MHIHRDFYDRTLAPKRELDVLRSSEIQFQIARRIPT